MNSKYINKFFLILLIFLSYSCKTIEKVYKEKQININQISNDDNYELIETISIKNSNNFKGQFLDYYVDDFDEEIILNKNIQKKFTINNFKKSYDTTNPLKLYIIDNYLYGIDIKSNLNIYNFETGKLVKSVKLLNQESKYISPPSSISMFDNNFIIGFKSGKIIRVNREGDILWEYSIDKILSTPIKIYNNNLIALYGDTIKIISIEKGNEILSESYKGSDVINANGGTIKQFANILYFILPNSSVGQIDTFFNEKTYSNFTLNDYQNSINNAYDEIHVFDNFVSYFDDKLNLYCYDIYLDKFILFQKRISQVDSFKFFNNSLIVKNENSIKAYNIKNGNVFWSFDLKKLINNDANIINIHSINNSVNVFFDSGMVLIINNKEIIDTFKLKIKNANFLYFQNNRIFFSLKNGKTTIF